MQPSHLTACRLCTTWTPTPQHTKRFRVSGGGWGQRHAKHKEPHPSVYAADMIRMQPVNNKKESYQGLTRVRTKRCTGCAPVSYEPVSRRDMQAKQASSLRYTTPSMQSDGDKLEFHNPRNLLHYLCSPTQTTFFSHDKLCCRRLRSEMSG